MVFQQKKFLYYYSRKLTPVETNYTTGNKKMFAVVVTLKHWRHLTQKTEHKMLVHTDHKKLMFFLETKQLNPPQIRWLKKLACYDFAIKRRCRRLEQKTKLQKSKQIHKTNAGQKRQLYANNRGN